MVICKKYNTCIYNSDCPYAKPCYFSNLQRSSKCYNFVKEEYYTVWLRKYKLQKIEQNYEQNT